MSSFRLSVLGLNSEHGAVTSTLAANCTHIDQVEDLFDPNKEFSGTRIGQRDFSQFNRRVWIVESAFSRYSHLSSREEPFKLERLLRENLGVPDDFFRNQARERTNFDSAEVLRCPRLPTALSLDKRFSLEHFELWTYLGSNENLQSRCSITNKTLSPNDKGYNLTCKTTKRQIQCHKWKTRGGWLLVAPRKCSYWSKSNRNGWDVVILCDPAPSRVQVGGETRDIEIRPFHGGPHGFIPEEYLDLDSQPFQNRVNAAFRPQHDFEELSTHAARDCYPRGIRFPTSQTTICPDNYQTDGSVSSSPPDHDTQASTTVMSEVPSRFASPGMVASTTSLITTTRVPEFVPHTSTECPPRTNFYDDLIYYFRNHSHLIKGLEDPISAALFPKKLVACHYSQLVGFVGHQAASMRTSGSALYRRADEQDFTPQNFMDSNSNKFCCTEYLKAMDTVMDHLGIPIYNDQYALPAEGRSQYQQQVGRKTSTSRSDHGRGGTVNPDIEFDWRSPVPDFLFLHRELRLRLADYDTMTTSMATLASAIGVRVSAGDARWIKALTIVAMLFIPPACIAAIFGMQGQFAASKGHFWVYWVVAVPVTALLFLLVFGTFGVGRMIRNGRAKRRIAKTISFLV